MKQHIIGLHSTAQHSTMSTNAHLFKLSINPNEIGMNENIAASNQFTLPNNKYQLTIVSKTTRRERENKIKKNYSVCANIWFQVKEKKKREIIKTEKSFIFFIVESNGLGLLHSFPNGNVGYIRPSGWTKRKKKKQNLHNIRIVVTLMIYVLINKWVSHHVF